LEKVVKTPKTILAHTFKPIRKSWKLLEKVGNYWKFLEIFWKWLETGVSPYPLWGLAPHPKQAKGPAPVLSSVKQTKQKKSPCFV
jgi:hypothetical protein